jgi:hypothetical protein
MRIAVGGIGRAGSWNGSVQLAIRSKIVFRISKPQYRQLLGKARRSSSREICGLLVDTGCFLSFVETANASKRDGSFLFRAEEIRKKPRQLGTGITRSKSGASQPSLTRKLLQDLWRRFFLSAVVSG